MRLIVGPARGFVDRPDLWRGADLVVLASPGASVPDLASRGRRLDQRFHDIAEPRPDLVAPDAPQVGELLVFAREAQTLAIACYAGVSRSTAAAYAIACQTVGVGAEIRLAARLRALSPAATPNPLMVAMADAQLGRGGSMTTAVAGIGRGIEAFEGPMFEWTLGADEAAR